MDKPELRTELRARRRAFVASLDPADRNRQLEALADLVVPEVPTGGTVASYRAVGDEIDPAAIEERLGRPMALPWFADRDAAMIFRLFDGSTEPGPFRIPQPPTDAAAVEPDILLVPLIAADVSRNRLGQGKGHYDRALTELRRRRPILTIGLAWDVQIVERLPVDPWDVQLDRVVTPTRILR